MLILSRKNGEAVVIGGVRGLDRTIKVTVVDLKNGRVRLAFDADAAVPVHRLEVWKRICGGSKTSRFAMLIELINRATG